MPFAYPHRAHLKLDLIERVARGQTIKAIAAEPGMPTTACIQVWRRSDPAFAAELGAARKRGEHRRRLSFDEVKAKAFLARVQAGETIRDLLSKPGMPTQRAYQYWRRTEASFAEELWRLKGVRDDARKLRLRGRYRKFDQAIADRIMVRASKGEEWRRMVDNDPTLPSRAVLYRWRWERPDWDRALKIAFRFGRHARGHPRALATPELAETILDRIVTGASLRSLGAEPGMPAAGTLYSWIAKDAKFAADVAAACDWREDWYLDQMVGLADQEGATSAADLRKAMSPLAQQRGRLQNRPGRKWRT